MSSDLELFLAIGGGHAVSPWTRDAAAPPTAAGLFINAAQTSVATVLLAPLGVFRSCHGVDQIGLRSF